MKQGAVRPSNVLAELNRQLVIQTVRKQGTLSRTDLAKQLNLSKPTVSKIVQELLTEGILVEAGVAESTGGKRATLLKFNARAHYVIGIVVAIDGTIFALATSDGTVVEQYQTRSCILDDPIEHLANGITNLITAKPPMQIVGIAIGMPSCADSREDTTVRETSAIAPALQSKFGIPVFVDTTINMAAIGELERGIAQGVQRFAYLHLGKALRVSIVSEGGILPGSPTDIGKVLMGTNTRSVRSIDALLKSSDSLSGTAHVLAITAFNINCILAPEVIVLAGNVSKELTDLTMKQYQSFPPETCPIKVSSLGNKAALLGSIHWAINSTRCDPLLSPLIEHTLK